MFVFKAGVVGAGTMGAEIAAVIAAAGIPVVLCDVDAARARRAASTAPRAVLDGSSTASRPGPPTPRHGSSRRPRC